jgi:hypothetical protein
VAHVYNPRYSDSRDQEDPRQIIQETLSDLKKKKSLLKGLMEWLKVKALSSSHSSAKKKKNSRRCGVILSTLFCFLRIALVI